MTMRKRSMRIAACNDMMREGEARRCAKGRRAASRICEGSIDESLPSSLMSSPSSGRPRATLRETQRAQHKLCKRIATHRLREGRTEFAFGCLCPPRVSVCLRKPPNLWRGRVNRGAARKCQG